MSLLGGGSECSTGANPLAHFNKHAQEDTSLQQSLRNQPGQQRRMMLREENQMSMSEKQHMESFMRNDQTGAFSFQPMANELSNIHRHTPLANQNIQRGNQFNPQEFQQLNMRAESAGPGWTSEFSQSVSHSPAQLPSQQQQPSMMRSSLNRPLMGGMSSGFMMGRSAMSHAPGVHANQADAGRVVEVESMQQWEDTFKEYEAGLQGREDEPIEVNANIMDGAFEQVWDNIQETYADTELTNDEYQAAWEKDFEQYAISRMNYGKYAFEEQNQFANDPDAYEIGLKLMESGAKLSEAALAFEAAVQQNPDHVNAWLKLGEVQTQNEKESAGISALEKCLQLSPENLPALMTLAISYVNDGYDNAAYATLERWIQTKYPQIAQQARVENPDIEADDRVALNKRITQLFIKAAQLSPDVANMDPDVQTGLGVLFYSIEEFDKTMDCFRAAIGVRPDDALSWNRLGASLANSNRPEEAIEAYSRALQLNPNFVRARYNLGVSYINMGMYDDAIEHLLTGLSMHKVDGLEEIPDGMVSNQSTSLLETLKRALLAMDRRDLIDKVKPGMDADSFRKFLF
ncbi:unnamed protein product [Kuraishia capsulata CBS 1993]|uniref:Peroxisomal targeting signal receptor n=1 Tax=Kuraishia capsulata CBS 1993 TaxID=1382522 RepID=W6MUP6_9ASCO|nr:uncharacterized protein KUCA_T00005445001 [Kuraishia capsulata CBS 1993]CDK29457.1 unnamed protein product [Kuraishia capsulata CBS 1993]